MKIGYARVSTKEQNLDVQLTKLKENGCEMIFQEKKSGVLVERLELNKCLEYLREGDTLLVYKLDRLGRSLKSIISLLDRLKERGVYFLSIEDKISTEGAANQLMTHIIGAFAQFERDIIIERCQEGRTVAKEKGVKFGRPVDKVNKKNEEKIKQCAALYNSGSSIMDIMKTLKIGQETIYRYLRKQGIEPNRGGLKTLKSCAKKNS